MSRRNAWRAVGLLAGVMALPFGLPLNVMVAPALANDWPYWRGPEQTGMTREKAPVTEWSPDGEGLLWKNDIGGRTTPVVMNGRVYTITPVGSDVNLQERVVCVDADTGQLVWEHRFNVFHTDMVENRVGWTAVVGDPETGNVYAHGTGGEFFCFDRDGKVVWKRSLTEEFGRISGYGGRLHTPIIDEDKVIISFLNSSWGAHARPLHRYLAMDKKTGEVIYWAEPGGAPLDTTYACPVVTVIDGKRLLIAPNADGWIYGMLVRTGETVWSYKLSKRGLNTSPVVDGNYVYVTQSEENYGTTEMGAVLCIDASKSGDITESGTVWRHDGYTVGYCSPAIANSRLYVVSNDATMYCFDAKSGERKWRHDLGRVGKGSPVVTADGVIYVGEQNGLFHILKDEGDECRSLSRYDFARTEEGEDEFFGSPAVANGRVYFQVRSGTYCLGVRDGDRQADVAIPALASGSAPFFGLAPADVTLAPGDAWRPRLALRHLELDDEEVAKQLSELPMTSQWSLEGLDGAMSAMPDGQLKVNDDASHAAGVVSAFESKTGAARSASARVRVIPSLPFVVDFEDMAAGSAPPGWIGCGRKVKIDERDGSRVLRKLADKQFPSPPFMRLMTFVTMPLEAGYTIECDMLSEAKRGRFKPDMGLVNARYQLVAMGMSKVLRVETWAAMPRLRVDVPFEFEPDKWYIMRFTVKLEGEQARLLGKVWLRGEEEPADWMIDVVDPCPNREGSAGLYAYSAGTTAKSDGPETYFDNLKVSRNAK